jgi:hypothetical protein
MDGVIRDLRRDADVYRRGLRANLRRAMMPTSRAVPGQMASAGLRSGTGVLSRLDVWKPRVYNLGDYDFKGLIKPRRVRLGMWIKSRKARIGDPFYWYFHEYGTGSAFTRARASRTRTKGARGEAGRGLRARHFLLAAGLAHRDEAVAIMGSSFDVFMSGRRVGI